MRRSVWFSVMWLAVAVAGCIDNAFLPEAQRTCRDRGLTAGTAAYDKCVSETLDALGAYWGARDHPLGG